MNQDQQYNNHFYENLDIYITIFQDYDILSKFTKQESRVQVSIIEIGKLLREFIDNIIKILKIREEVDDLKKEHLGFLTMIIDNGKKKLIDIKENEITLFNWELIKLIGIINTNIAETIPKIKNRIYNLRHLRKNSYSQSFINHEFRFLCLNPNLSWNYVN